MAQDITVKIGEHLFNYRVAAIVRRKNDYLVCRSKRDNFCYLPGGRVKDGESSLEAVVRELQEELEVVAKVERLAFSVENFFSLRGKRVHELCLYYEVVLPGSELLLRVADDDDELLWVNAAETKEVNLKPDFLRDQLENLPQTLEHVVLYDS